MLCLIRVLTSIMIIVCCTVRLVDSKDVFYGRLEVYVNKTFRSVCDTGFTDVAASIVCRQLGYKFGRKQCCSALGTIDASNITVSNVFCMSHEKKLENCNYTISTCPSKNYVSVYCSAKAILPSTGEDSRYMHISIVSMICNFKVCNTAYSV